MQVDVKKLLEFIFESDVSASPACQACEDALDVYIDAELDGQDVATLFPNVKAHLNECAPCQESYQELKTLLVMARRGTFVEPPVEANFDFSFVPPPQPTSIWQVVERAGREVRQLFTELHIVVKKGAAFFDQLPNPLVAQWELVPMATRAEGEEEQEHVLEVPSGEPDLLFRYSVVPPTSDKTTAELKVKVIQHSSQKPVARVRVTLRDEKGRMLESNMTRQDGLVSFVHVQPARYLLEVKFKKERWQIRVTVTYSASDLDSL
ncbi:MAG: hypothetical protein ACPGWR_01470 [Ardenticatenaceae bacterium]